MTLPSARIAELFRADLKEGRLYWRAPSKFHSEKAGTEAGSPRANSRGKTYWIIKIDGHPYRRGHLIFCIVNGRFPAPMLDHINGDSLDDRPGNLREATATQNAWNHKGRKRRIALPMGVRLCKSGRFEARISHNKRQLHLGSFATAAEAHSIYLAKRKELFGEFA